MLDQWNREHLPRVARAGLGPQFSPDGKWIAVTTDESGRYEVYVRSFPDPSSRVQVSVAGGAEPTWSSDGTRLYYRSGDAILAARVELAPAFRVLARDTVFATAGFLSSGFQANYGATRDGRRFLALISNRDDFQLVVSPNWITEMRQRLAASGAR